MKCNSLFWAAVVCSIAGVLTPISEARAQLVLSELVIDLEPAKRARHDIEIWNKGADRTYVAVEPREVIRPGTPTESRVENPDPEELGLLVSPVRMVLDPGQRRLLRVAAIGKDANRERVYRITVKPVVGQLASDQAGLKILVGYDALVLVRPPNLNPNLVGVRAGEQLILRNEGNVSVELVDGKECDLSKKMCDALPGGRLYAGAEKRISVRPGRRAHYLVKIAGKAMPREF